MSQTLADRIEALRQSWEAGDLGRLTSHWAENIQFSDYCAYCEPITYLVY